MNNDNLITAKLQHNICYNETTKGKNKIRPNVTNELSRV